eukprot:116821_1
MTTATSELETDLSQSNVYREKTQNVRDEHNEDPLPTNFGLWGGNDSEEDLEDLDLFKNQTLEMLTIVIVDELESDAKEGIENDLNKNIISLEGLTSDLTSFELRQRVTKQTGWRDEELRLWKQEEYTNFKEALVDPFNREFAFFPEPLELPADRYLFPELLTGEILIAQRTKPLSLQLPTSTKPVIYGTKDEWLESRRSLWKGEAPPKDSIIYSQVDTVRTELGKGAGSLFMSLYYLLHEVDHVKGVKEGATPSIRRGMSLRKQMAGFVACSGITLPESEQATAELRDTECCKSDNPESESQTTSSREPESRNVVYARSLLSKEHKGSDLDIWLCAMMAGCIIQVFDVPNQRLKEYGKGFVESYGNPHRLSERFTIKLALFSDGRYEPLIFCNCATPHPNRIEEPFRIAKTILTFDWLAIQNPKSARPTRWCNQCHKRETRAGMFSHCGQCKMPVYCSKLCQRRDWTYSHRDVCEKVNPDKLLKNAIKRDKWEFTRIRDFLAEGLSVPDVIEKLRRK